MRVERGAQFEDRSVRSRGALRVRLMLQNERALATIPRLRFRDLLVRHQRWLGACKMECKVAVIATQQVASIIACLTVILMVILCFLRLRRLFRSSSLLHARNGRISISVQKSVDSAVELTKNMLDTRFSDRITFSG